MKLDKTKKTIAIVGAGFCGLAVAWHLSNQGHQVTIFEKAPLSNNASGLSAGLLHPYAGPQAKLSINGREGMKATCELLDIAAKALGEPTYKKSGFLRVALTPEQIENFKKSAQIYDDVIWWDNKQCQQQFPGLADAPGIYLPEARHVYTEKYLQGLWMACANNGVLWNKCYIQSLDEINQIGNIINSTDNEINQYQNSTQLNDYDIQIIAGGYLTPKIKTLNTIPFNPVKGQLIEFEWPKHIPEPPFPVSSQAYIVPSDKPHHYFLGATFEHHFVNDQPDIEFALNFLIPRLTALYPNISDMGEIKITKCLAGVRGSTPNRQPYIKQHTEKLWVFGGMGSKGLLWHAKCAKELADLVGN